MSPAISESAKSVSGMIILAAGGCMQHRIRLENLQELQYNTLVLILSDQWKGLP